MHIDIKRVFLINLCLSVPSDKSKPVKKSFDMSKLKELKRPEVSCRSKLSYRGVSVTNVTFFKVSGSYICLNFIQR